MSGKIGEDLIEEVRRNNDIVEVISEYINLKKAGKNYQGLCPFHSEKTPSFSVNEDKQLFHCFGCKAGGNVFNFIMGIENLSFGEAVELLARRARISLPQKDDHRIKGEKEQLYEANLLANKYFHYLLTQTKWGGKASIYLEQRGIKKETIEEFKLGYAANNWDGLLRSLKKRGFSPELLEKAGLVVARQQKEGYYDRFRHRLMFPILDSRGRVIGFGGRVLDDSLPKYLNSPETILFNKSKNLYGLFHSRKKIKEENQAIIVEGYMDFLTLYQAGIKNVVASLGTALTQEQAKLLSRYTEEVIIAYDADLAGTSAAMRGLEILQAQGLKVRILDLPPGYDPDAFLRERGSEELLNLLAQASPWIEYNLQKALTEYQGVGQSKSVIVEKVLPILAKVANQIERDEYIRFLAEKLAIREEALRSELHRLKRPLERGKLRNREEKIRNNNNDQVFSLPSFKAEKTLLNLILRNKEVGLWSKEVLSAEDFLNENHKRIFTFLGELINTVDLEWAVWVEQLENQQLKEAVLDLLMEETPEGMEPERIALDCLNVIRKCGLEQKINQLQWEIRQAEERGEYNRVRILLDECQELIRRRKELA